MTRSASTALLPTALGLAASISALVAASGAMAAGIAPR